MNGLIAQQKTQSGRRGVMRALSHVGAIVMYAHNNAFLAAALHLAVAADVRSRLWREGHASVRRCRGRSDILVCHAQYFLSAWRMLYMLFGYAWSFPEITDDNRGPIKTELITKPNTKP